MINPEWIRSFETLARMKHFTRTAKQLGMTQPGVSQHLRKLEEELGCALIDRGDKSFRLLPAGEKFLNFIIESKKSESLLRESIKGDSPIHGRCRYSSPGGLGLLIFDAFMNLASRHEGLSLEFVVAPSLSVERAVEADEVDVGYTHHAPTSQSVLSEKIAEEKLLLVVPKTFKSRKNCDWNELVALGIVKHPDIYRHAQRLLSLNFPRDFGGVELLPSRTSVNQNNRILEPVALGLGFTIIHEISYRRSSVRNDLAIVELAKPLRDPVYRIQARRRKLPMRFDKVDSEILMALHASLKTR
ncbi:MAG: LysR family transcriptional regulator [Bdellovibrionota bacterium]